MQQNVFRFAACAALLALPALSLFADSVALEVEGPAFSADVAEYQLVFHNETSGGDLQYVRTAWLHRLAESLYQLPQNALLAEPLDLMLGWEIVIGNEGTVGTGWYLERGRNHMHIQPGLFGADSWGANGTLVVRVAIPVSQATDDVGIITSGLRADHYATDADTEHHFVTQPPATSNPSNRGAQPEVHRLGTPARALLLRWESLGGVDYRLERSTDLTSWEEIGEPLEGDGYPLQSILPVTDDRAVFYRVQIAEP